jgi:hypothetical protein
MNAADQTPGLLIDTVCGTALTVVMNLSSEDIDKTVVLAALGAVVSFGVSWLLKWLVEKWKRPPACRRGR